LNLVERTQLCSLRAQTVECRNSVGKRLLVEDSLSVA
jgi:hypothetical protein